MRQNLLNLAAFPIKTLANRPSGTPYAPKSVEFKNPNVRVFDKYKKF